MSSFLFFSSSFHFTACFLVLLLHFLTKVWFNNRVINLTDSVVGFKLLTIWYHLWSSWIFFMSFQISMLLLLSEVPVSQSKFWKWIYLEEIFIQNFTVLKSLPWLAIPTDSFSSLLLPNRLVNINSLYCLPYIFYHFSSLNFLLSGMICFSLMILFTCPVALVCAC